MSYASLLRESLNLPAAIIALATMVVSGAPLAETLVLSPYRAEYKVGNETMKAGMVVSRLTNSGDRWRYESNTNPSSLVALYGPATATATSLLEYRDGELRPLEFTYRDKDKKKKAHADANFDWQKNQVIVKYGDKTATLELPGGATFDATSAVLALGLALREGFDEITLNLLTKDRIDKVTFRNEGEEEIEVPFGKFSAIKVREVKKPGKRFLTSWFVPELGYLPVRMEQYNKDKLVARTLLVKLERE